MEQRSLRVVETNKTFFTKISTTISRILIPTRIGINSMMISLKRNAMLKCYATYTEAQKITDIQKKELASQKFEDAYALYLEAIDKNIMESIYKKVKSGVANSFEKEALAKYYFVVSLKNKDYVEYKYRKQEYLLRVDYETVSGLKKQSLIKQYKDFYAVKMNTLYKGLLKNYSVKLSDSSKHTEEVYNKIFDTLDTYLTDIIPIIIEKNKKMQEQYEQFEHTKIGKTDENDNLIRKMILLGISRDLFAHSFPLLAAEKCYIKLLKQARDLIASSKHEVKREKAYQTFFTIVEEYNVKLLSTRVYWDKPQDRENYKKFWENYQKVKEDEKQKAILVLKNDIKDLRKAKTKYDKIIEIHKQKLTALGVIKALKNSSKTIEKDKKYGAMKRKHEKKLIV